MATEDQLRANVIKAIVQEEIASALKAERERIAQEIRKIEVRERRRGGDASASTLVEDALRDLALAVETGGLPQDDDAGPVTPR